MATIRLCQNDPLAGTLYHLFGANIVRVPDTQVQPLCVVAHRGGRSSFRGSLLPLLDDGRPLGLQPVRSQLSAIAGKRSRKVTLDLGIHLLRGFLKGFGLPGAELISHLGGASTLAFSFPSVQRIALDINALGWALGERRIDPGNPAAAIFFESPRHDLLLIDSVLTSSEMTVTLGSERGSKLDLDISALRRLAVEIGANVNAEGTADVELTLNSPHELTFAFTCVRLALEEDGRVGALPPDHRVHTLGAANGRRSQPAPDAGRVLLSTTPGLLVWDA